MDNATILKRMEANRLFFASLLESTTGPRDWVEDFTDENGCYDCSCAYCLGRFTGHKRRVVCKVCDRALNELL